MLETDDRDCLSKGSAIHLGPHVFLLNFLAIRTVGKLLVSLYETKSVLHGNEHQGFGEELLEDGELQGFAND